MREIPIAKHFDKEEKVVFFQGDCAAQNREDQLRADMNPENDKVGILSCQLHSATPVCS